VELPSLVICCHHRLSSPTGLAGENSWDAAVIDMICDTTTDVFNQAAQASFSPTNETKVQF